MPNQDTGQTTHTAATSASNSSAPATLHGFRLVVARIGWLLMAVVTLALFGLSIGPGYAALRTACTTAPCSPEQLTPAGVQAIETLGFPLAAYALYNTAIVGIFFLLYFLLAVLIFWRRSNDRMALFVSFTLLLVALFLPDWTSVLVPIYPGLRFPLNILNAIMLICFFAIFYVFPDGRFVPHWTRWVMLLWIGLLLLTIFVPEEPSDPSPDPTSRLIEIVVGVGLLLALVGTGLYAQFYRFRYVSDAVQRQQTKWVVFGLMATLSAVLVTQLPVLVEPSLEQPGTLYDLIADFVSFLVTLLIPLSFSVAILRYRLFDIDVIIRRTLIYGVLTSLLAVIYIGSVVMLQWLLTSLIGGNDQIAIVGSTLGIATLFQPLRRSIQATIDRRFYRRKYDTQKTLQAFAAGLREETDLEQLTDNMVRVVQDALQPAHVSVWLCERDNISRA